MTTHDDDSLTERQRDVLRLHQDGKSPTEIGKELDISSQGVHGHLRRLRDKGLVEREPSRRSRPKPAPAPVEHEQRMASMALTTVRDTIAQQEELIRSRQAAIVEQMAELQGEKDHLDELLNELAQYGREAAKRRARQRDNPQRVVAPVKDAASS